jgi:hypothetical protein
LQSFCTLQAIAETGNARVILQNPQPGTRGNFGQNRFYAPGRWNLDMALSKSVRVTETKRFQLRVDATNVFNHPTPSGTAGGTGTRIVFPTAPDVNINGTNPFGFFGTKVGTRTLQATLRFDF